MVHPSEEYFVWVKPKSPVWPFEVRSVGYKSESYPMQANRPQGADFYIFMWTVKGQGFLKCNKRSFCLEPETLFIMPPNCPHTYGAIKNPSSWVSQWFTLRGSATPFILKGLKLEKFTFMHTTAPSLSLFMQLYSMLRIPGQNNQIEDAQLGLRLIYDLAARLEPKYNESKNSRFSELAEYVRENIQTGINVNEMAKYLKISRSHFSRAFSTATGVSPRDFLLEARINRAKELLMTRETIKEIAFKSGWCDPAHFCRQFKQVTGTTPRRFRISPRT